MVIGAQIKGHMFLIIVRISKIYHFLMHLVRSNVEAPLTFGQCNMLYGCILFL